MSRWIKSTLTGIPWIIGFVAGGWAGPFPAALGWRWVAIYAAAAAISALWEVNVEELYRRYPEFPSRSPD